MCYRRPKHLKNRSTPTWLTQGSSFLRLRRTMARQVASLGWRTQSLWDWDDDWRTSRLPNASPGHIALPLKPHADSFALVVAAASVVFCLVAIQALADRPTTNITPLIS